MKRTRLSAKKHKAKQNKRYFSLKVTICGAIVFCLVAFVFSGDFNSSSIVSAEDSMSELENALYTREEFFGAKAVVPLPTAQARENIAKLAEKQPDNPQILEKLAELDEKLSNFDETEKILSRLAETNGTKLENLAAFYERRGRFEKQAEVLRKILATSGAEKRADIFGRLIDLARKHDLKAYLQPDFYAEIAKENADVYAVFEQLADKLIEDKNYPEALNFVRQAKVQFPARESELLGKEINILLATGNSKEAEAVYRKAFNPFWSDEEAGNFYDFLNQQDRLRAYGAELKAAFKRNPADFEAGIQLALYQNHDYSYGNDKLTPIILKLEQNKKDWTTEELVIVTRLLLKANEAETASRFLYTLYLREDFKKNSELRSKILYQLFEMFSDAQTQRLPLTKGDLRFYENVAKTDTSPGIATGLLSLVFSDTSPRERFEEQETEANKYFNRAAAYRIFTTYKEEFPTSPELAQMYLDIVRLYTATKEIDIAERTLNEFEQRYENSSDYPVVALKLADAFTAVNRPEKTREIYQKILDYLGKQGKLLAPKTERPAKTSDNLSNEIKADANDGINIPTPKKTPENDYDYDNEPTIIFHDYLDKSATPVKYSDVLENLVSSLAKEKKTEEILAIYSKEIQKYPDEEWLYDQRLSWLEQTNLGEEELKIYQQALARFQSRSWQDKLARWFLREKRQSDFAEFSKDLVGKLNDREVQDYLSKFVDAEPSVRDLQKQLSLSLYQAAHERFPHNQAFVRGLLSFYRNNKQETEWRNLAAEYYFEFSGVREQFLSDLAERGKLREYLDKANGESTIYELFRADANARLSNFENAVAAYRKLDQLYPNTPEFSERLIRFTRSFGQKSRDSLSEAAKLAETRANFESSISEYRTRSGEIYAELGDYQKSNEEWGKLISTAQGEKATYLDAATVYWDYYQYDEALQSIKKLRERFDDETLYAFETGAIYEAQHKQPEAVSEYVKALGVKDDETQKEKAKKRLAALFNRERNGKEIAETSLEKQAAEAFLKESGKRVDSSSLTLGYAEFLSKIKRDEKADGVLIRAVRQSKNQEFIESARDFYQSEDNEQGEQLTLKRLAEITESPRKKIGYRLQIVESLEEDQKRELAKDELTRIVREYPLNYGVLTEAANLYSRLGFENESVLVLQNALPKSVDKFRYRIAKNLSTRLIRLNRLDSARQILENLREQDKTDTETFGDLAKVYVRLNDAGGLRKAFDETVSAFKKSDMDRRGIDAEITDLRGQMVDAFTRLKDYKSAVEQHIEIINNDPEEEELTENAIRYVQRYGGADTLLGYYQKTSAQSFKNYRWNVVLARIYEAQNDWGNAAKNYEAAIINQPEMPELYLSLADAELKQNNFDDALKNIDEVLMLTNDGREYVKKKIEILKKAGRFAEAEKEKAKLPAEEQLKVNADQFAEARNVQNTEKDKARQLYREAFDRLMINPLSGEFKTADLTAYVISVREEEPLNRINERFWTLREKLIEKANELNSTQAGEARNRLSILDGALTESIGSITHNVGTDEELAALHADWQRRIEKALMLVNDNQKTLSLITDLSRRAGFGDLEEEILLKKLKAATVSSDKRAYLQNLIGFYNERGAYQKTFDLLAASDSDNLSLKAETARLVGNRESELEALRGIYWKVSDTYLPPDADVARYLEILQVEKREELKSLTEKSSAYQLQLINFLLSKGEKTLAHAAIESAKLSQAWKASRHAETSLALRELDENSECYFCDALQFDLIGNLVHQNPDKKSFLVGDDWFRLTREYGEWLYERRDKEIPPAQFLVAMTENQPRNAEQQFKLGEFYLEKNEFNSAIEHYRLALELEPEDSETWASLGAAYYLAGKKDLAESAWSKALENEEIGNSLSFLQILQEYGLAEKARERIASRIVSFLKENDADRSEDFQTLIRAVAASFENEDDKSAYFLKLLSQRPTDTSLAKMLINESLISKPHHGEFYELVIKRSGNSSGYYYDYNLTSLSQRVWAAQDIESVYDQENNYEVETPDKERFEWQVKYLHYLIAQNENSRANLLIKEIEKELNGRYLSPPEVRLAKIQLGIRAQHINLAEIERFIGISVSSSVTEIKAPNLERFNDVLRVLKEESRTGESRQISESFFARMIALGYFETANFAGLSRSLFEQGRTEEALQILQLMIDAGDENKRETASAEIASLPVIKKRAADTAKLAEIQSADSINQFGALQTAAEIAAEFREIKAAVSFRRLLLEANPDNLNNQIELAKTFIAQGEKAEGVNLLTQLINSRDSSRSARWQARMILLEMGENIEIPNNKYDFFSQFYNGVIAVRNNQNEQAGEYFINSLIAEKNAETSAGQELIKFYAVSNEPFAALKLAENEKFLKSDELLQILSESAEKVGDFARAIEYEKAKSNVDENRVVNLQKLSEERNKTVTDFTVDSENTRKL